MGVTDPAASDRREYELDDDENEEVGSVATHSIVWGAVCVAAGLACLFALVSPALRTLPSADPRLLVPASVVQLSLGLTFLLSGARFRSAVTTRDRDISHVMTALRYLSGALLVQIVVAGLTVIGIAAVVFFSLVAR